MTKIQNTKQYDLEERALNFAKNVIEFVNKLPKTLTNVEISKQLVRSAGSMEQIISKPANLLVRRIFLVRIKICRKEVLEFRIYRTRCFCSYLF